MNADRLLIAVCWDGSRITGVRVAEGRAVAASRLLEGQPPAEVPPLVARLFHICGRGQAAAARLALAAATGNRAEVDPLQVQSEAAVDSLWRLCIDLPNWLGQPPDLARLAALRGALPATDTKSPDWWGFANLLPDHIEALLPGGFPGQIADWDSWLEGGPPLARHLAGLPGCTRRVAAPTFLAPGHLAGLAGQLAVAGFAECPHLSGVPAETGALARCREEPLIRALLRREGATPRARFAARLLELARAPAELTRLLNGGAAERLMGAISPAPGVGIGWAETARGLLIHRTEVAAGRVVSYRIVAPTEWNFHPEGAVTALTGVPAADAEMARRLADLMVLALDPCVSHTVEVHHA